MITKEQIHKLIDESIWKIDPSRKVFNSNSVIESSEMFVVWNDNITFTIHGLRETINNTLIKIDVIVIFYPKFDANPYITLDRLDVDWENNNLQIANISEFKDNEDLCKKVFKKE